MTATPADLLAGPRGRRLCLELAMALDGEVGSAVTRLALMPGDVSLTTDQAAKRIAGLNPLPAPMAAHLLPALATAVDEARYWQEPDGLDLFAELVPVRAALHGVARAILEHPQIAWWDRADAEQWAVHWHDDHQQDDAVPTGPPDARTSPLTAATWSARAREAEQRARRRARRRWWRSVEVSGEWWSAPTSLPSTRTRLPECLALVEDRFDPVSATAVPVEPASRPLVLHGPQDWIDLCRRFPLDVTASRGPDWRRATGRAGRWTLPDWEAVSHAHDAVTLTVLGWLTTAGRPLEVTPGLATVLAGWSPGETYRLTGPPHETAAGRRDWAYDEEAHTWVPGET